MRWTAWLVSSYRAPTIASRPVPTLAARSGSAASRERTRRTLASTVASIRASPSVLWSMAGLIWSARYWMWAGRRPPDCSDQRYAQFQDAVGDAAEHGLVEDLSGRADGHQVAQSLVEDQLRGHAGVDAAEYDGEGVLGGGQLPPDGGGFVRVAFAEGPPAAVARGQFREGLLRGAGPRSGAGCARGGGGRAGGCEARAEGRGPGQRGAQESAADGAACGRPWTGEGVRFRAGASVGGGC
jgi:hypothetical protein